MTNEEAIKVLSALWAYKAPQYSETEIREALDLAIKALDESPKVDITEEQAIDKLHETWWMQKHDKEMTERPTGEWIPIYPLTDKCSLCNGEALDFNDYPYRSKFCPHCGAKMKGGGTVAENDLYHQGP